jgi:hypothetical protein
MTKLRQDGDRSWIIVAQTVNRRRFQSHPAAICKISAVEQPVPAQSRLNLVSFR